MNSALKPVLTSSAPQNPSVTTQLNKPMHPQGTPANYGQPSSHMPQSLLPHNPTAAHTHPNPAHQTNHYSLNVPNAPQHYTPSNPPTIPASNHPVPNVSHAPQGGQNYSPNKNMPFAGGYQPNLGHPPNNPIPPVSQTLPATQPAEVPEKPQSNGTPEAKSPTKPELQENHISLPRDKSPPSSLPKLTDEKPTAQTEQKDKEENSVAKDMTSSAPSVDKPDSVPVSTSGETKAETTCSSETSSIEGQSEPMDVEESGETAQAQSTTPKKEKEAKATPTLKTTPKTPTRKSKTPKSEGDSPKSSKSENKTPQKTPIVGIKTKRTRIKTQPYQSPLPEIEIITKISSSTPRNKNTDDKLIVFYKNEFLAVRNSEGSFYICQAVQNIYKSSPKIRIRWLSQDKTDKNGEIYTPDFYDNTDFDCILTNLKLVRVDKGKYRLPPAEKERTDSILKRSLAVEKGEVTSPSLTEEHPDGIDVSLIKEEAQVRRRRAIKRKATSALRTKKADNTTKSPEQPKVRKVVKAKKALVKKVVKTKKVEETKKATPGTSRTDRAKRRSDTQNHTKVNPVVDQKKAKVLAKVARKGAVNTKSQSAKSTKSPKATAKKPSKAAKKTKKSRK